MPRGGGGGGQGQNINPSSNPTAHEVRGKRNPSKGPGVTWDPRMPRKAGRRSNPAGKDLYGQLSLASLMILKGS